MNARVVIRPAVKEDQEAISRLRIEALSATGQSHYSQGQLVQWATRGPTVPSSQMLTEGCVLVAACSSGIVACNGLDLDQREIMGLFVSPGFQGQGLGRRMLEATERLAIQYGLTQLRVQALPLEADFYRACGYQSAVDCKSAGNEESSLQYIVMQRTFIHRQTRYSWRISKLLEQIGIPADYGARHQLKLQPESRELATVAVTEQGREHMLHPDAAMAWYAMRNAADSEGVTLEIASAFRSVGYQVSIIERKLHSGQALEHILQVSAAPGYSEHHSGKALDITCPGYRPFEECFENSAAFEWLTYSAARFGFNLSYPRNNGHRIAYEPWHWLYTA